MVQLVQGATNPTCRELLAKMFRQRYEIFVKEKGWKIKSYNGIEFDQYDTAETLYLIDLDRYGNVAASTRMIRTDQPIMLADVFADMCERPIPRGPHCWELTRGAMSKNLRGSGHYGRIQCGLIEGALLFGVNTGCGLFSVDLLMSKIRSGLDAKPLGQPRMIDGEPHLAADFPLTGDMLGRTRALFKIKGPVLEHLHLMPAPQQRKAA
jgi:N-acyl-L-homoserine lactone synthetase